MYQKMIGRLWRDQSGAVLAAEYLMLGSVVAVGGVVGLTALRDGVAEEHRAFGRELRDTRHQYTVPVDVPTPRATSGPGRSGATTTAPIVVPVHDPRSFPAPHCP